MCWGRKQAFGPNGSNLTVRARHALGYALVVAGAWSMVNPAWAGCASGQPTRTPMTRYIIVKDGKIYDKKTDLTWRRCSVGQKWEEPRGCVGAISQMAWSEALSLASNGWRLPTKDELASLISPTCKNPAINEKAFPGMELNKLWYWSSTKSDGDAAWNVGFWRGTVQACYSWFANAVRLVRRGT